MAAWSIIYGIYHYEFLIYMACFGYNADSTTCFVIVNRIYERKLYMYNMHGYTLLRLHSYVS